MSDDVLSPPPEKPPPTFGRLAKRIRSRTTDLLAIAVVIAGGLAVGSQVGRWWDRPDTADDPAANALKNAAGPAAGLGDSGPVTLDFGRSPYTMIRAVRQGDHRAAVQQLVDDCSRIAVTTPFPSHPPSAAEKNILLLAMTEQPLLRGNDWKLFRVPGPLTMVSVIRNAKTAPAAANAAPRVVCWGLVFPAEDKRWVLYRFVCAGGSTQAESRAAVPLPSSASPLLTIRGGNHVWQTFRTRKPLDAVRAFYAGWFRGNGWTLTGSSGEWTAVFKKDDLRANVQISTSGSHGCTGVIVVTGIK